MKVEMGLLDEVFGVFIGASFTLTFFNSALSVPGRVGPLFFGLVIIPGLLIALKFEERRKRSINYLVWFLVAIVMGLTMVFRLNADAVASFSLPVGIAFWAIAREVVEAIEAAGV